MIPTKVYFAAAQAQRCFPRADEIVNDLTETAVERSPSCKNRLLLALPTQTRNEIIASAERRPLTEGQVLYNPGDAFTYAVFVEEGVVSEISDLGDGAYSESSTIGNESHIGAVSILMKQHSRRLYIVRVAGDALFVPIAVLDDLTKADVKARNVFMRQREAMLNASLQNTACGTSHSIAQRTARWLLEAHDRVEGDRFELRQSTLADALGVRRASVSVVCSALAEKGAISYVRGYVSIDDRDILEENACGCYRVVGRGFDEALTPLPDDGREGATT